MPGGGMKPKEDATVSIIREVAEETGLIISSPILIDTTIATHQYKIDTIHVFRAEVTDPTMVNVSPEINEMKWFNKNELPANASWLVQKYIDKIQ